MVAADATEPAVSLHALFQHLSSIFKAEIQVFSPFTLPPGFLLTHMTPALPSSLRKQHLCTAEKERKRINSTVHVHLCVFEKSGDNEV